MIRRSGAIRVRAQLQPGPIPMQVDPDDRLDLEEPVERLRWGPGRARHDRVGRQLLVDVEPQERRVRDRLLQRPPHMPSIPVTPGHVRCDRHVDAARRPRIRCRRTSRHPGREADAWRCTSPAQSVATGPSMSSRSAASGGRSTPRRRGGLRPRVPPREPRRTAARAVVPRDGCRTWTTISRDTRTNEVG